jgi:hypoxanthine-guanine phosphoribosyltransferase
MATPHVTEFLSGAEVDARVKALAGEIRRASGPDTPVHLVGELTGAFINLAEQMRAIGGTVSSDFIAESS